MSDRTKPPPGYEAPEVGPGWPTLYFYNDDGDHDLEAVWERAERRAAPLIAAELRRLAEVCATMFDERPGTMVGMGKGLAATAIAEHLRKRADELDTPKAE